MDRKNNRVPELHPQAIRRAFDHLDGLKHDLNYISAVMGDGPLSDFENKFGSVVDAPFVVALSNCTSALYTALLGLSVGRGDEVILPAYTWPQTLIPVILTGATPVFADIESGSYSIDPDSVCDRISSRTRAIIGVHLYGIPADAIRLSKIARQSKCTLIFDAAQGFGATLGGKGMGAYGDFVAYSFGLGKLLSIGEGGALVCKSRTLYDAAVGNSQHPLRMHKEIDNHRLRKSIDGVAMNFRMHPLVASLALGQIEGIQKSRKIQRMREHYKKTVSTLEKLNLTEYLPKLPLDASPSGVTLPLIINNVDDILNIIGCLENHEFEIYEGGMGTPLHLTYTIKKRRLFSNSKNSGRKIPFHDTHIEGSCPNAETRTRFPQLFIKL